MSDLFLIAHKVRSEPAFDIATRVECSSCKQEDGDIPGCNECDELGYWWIVPTSGHRAYPWWSIELLDVLVDHELKGCGCNYKSIWKAAGEMPPSLPDHYTTCASPARPSLASLLAIPRPTLKVDRRF